ncbi:hypothetical protein O0L34_g4229 [Tuta absoluta]|nr:hypothetical protein O0L34_g4229 [Tuta absoluta]
MKTFSFSFLFLALICAGLASPSPHALVRHRRQLGFLQNTGKLVQELISNLNKAAQQAQEAVEQFKNGLLDQAKQCRERFMQGLNDLQERVSDSIDKLQEKFTGSQAAIGECINAHRGDAQKIYQDASKQMAACADLRLQEGEELTKNLMVLGDNGRAIAAQAFEEMRNCTEQHNDNILAVGSCIGSVALRTEAKGASFLMQYGLAFGRLNLFMSTLPASLEVCAGSSLVNAGMGTAKVLMDIGSCSTTSVINTFGGGSLPSFPPLPIDASSITDAAASAAASASGAAESAGSTLSNAASSVLAPASSAAEFADSAISNTASSGLAPISLAAETAGSTLSSAASSALAPASSAAESAQSAISTATSSALNALQSALPFSK